MMVVHLQFGIRTSADEVIGSLRLNWRSKYALQDNLPVSATAESNRLSTDR